MDEYIVEKARKSDLDELTCLFKKHNFRSRRPELTKLNIRFIMSATRRKILVLRKVIEKAQSKVVGVIIIKTKFWGVWVLS